MNLNIAEIIHDSRVNGPGNRSIIWLQGCPHNCPGCYNQDFRPYKQAYTFDVKELYDTIVARKEKIEGVTFSGGEPFYQAEGLYYLSKLLKNRGLNIMCYSGYTYEQLLVQKGRYVPRLLSKIDILIDGPYVRERQGSFLWRGSDNQKIYFFDDKLRTDRVYDASEIEVIVDEDGDITITGTFMEDEVKPLFENNLKSAKGDDS